MLYCCEECGKTFSKEEDALACERIHKEAVENVIGETLYHLLNLLKEYCDIDSLDICITTSSEKERENIKKRQRQGIDVMSIVDGKRISAKTGNPTGRPTAEYPDNWSTVYEQWRADSITAAKAMQLLGLKRTTFYKLVKRYESND